MTLLGLGHFTLMIVALGLGVRILLGPKGTSPHKKLGRVFVSGMLLSNLIVFGIYEDTASPGVFHALAIVSALSLVCAVALVRIPGAGVGRRIAHGHVMVWSYGGIVAAGLGQVATGFDLPPWPVILATFLGVAVAVVRTDFASMLERR